ncbi:PREDICTED: uncharacterized protein LOC109130233 [Camelina sativa]|uniref:Uncharacterized protein LOC109130233 n=1 Tax=Camelina sativa TaxID=90675 RepID=A0ABM1R887_CAMSA|nr:PREDICTED: uncharacterized protein LOC109130233 [Camelina sativa]
MVYLLLYVDEIILTASRQTLIDSFTESLKAEFPITDGGRLSYFLGVKAEYNKAGILLSQSHYAKSIIAKANMEDYKPVATPVDVNSKLIAECGEKIQNPTEYQSLAGAMQYLTFTRPNITYAGTLTHGLQLYRGTVGSLTAYTDSDWTGCSDTRRSTLGYCVYLCENLISWSSKRQQIVSRSSVESEYKGVANVVAETCWIRNLLLEMHIPI